MLNIGAASIVINGKTGSIIQGATVKQCAARVRDDLEANALLLESPDETVMLISCDLAVLDAGFVGSARKAISAAISIPDRNIIITCTHTHSAPSVYKTCYTKPVDSAYLDSLSEWLLELAVKTRASVRPARMGWNSGSAKIGYNRRLCWVDGSHTAGGYSNREGFAGMEGPEDDGHYVLCAVDDDNNPIAILHSNTSHPTNFYGADFFSADYPGASRGFLREIFGKIPVLYLNGACGDTGPVNYLINNDSVCRDGEKGMLRLAHIITGQTVKQIYEMTFHDNPELKHMCEDLQVPVRLPEPEGVAQAEEVLKKVDNGETVGAWEQVFAFGIVDLQERFGKHPVDTVPVHVVQIGELALTTQPCELFCHFGLEIKKRSPFPITLAVGYADGFNGYCPTVEGIIGGGYSGKAISWSRLSHDAGYKIVDCASKLLRDIMACPSSKAVRTRPADSGTSPEPSGEPAVG